MATATSKRSFRRANSLSLVCFAFLPLFLASIVFHAMSGAHSFSSEQTAHGEPAVSTLEYIQTSRF